MREDKYKNLTANQKLVLLLHDEDYQQYDQKRRQKLLDDYQLRRDSHVKIKIKGDAHMSNYMKFFKQREADKINNEILEKLYPLEVYENNRKLGIAEALRALYELAETYCETGNNEEFNAEELIHIIKEYAGSDEVLNEYFYRLINEKSKI